MMWHKFDDELPEVGKRVILVLDNCSSIMGLVIDPTNEGIIDILEAEQGDSVGAYCDGSIWAYLPDDFELHFMTINEADWY